MTDHDDPDLTKMRQDMQLSRWRINYLSNLIMKDLPRSVVFSGFLICATIAAGKAAEIYFSGFWACVREVGSAMHCQMGR